MSTRTTVAKQTSRAVFDRKRKVMAIHDHTGKLTVLARDNVQYTRNGKCFNKNKVHVDVDTIWRNHVPLAAAGLKYKIAGKKMTWTIDAGEMSPVGTVTLDTSGRISRAQTESGPGTTSVTTFAYPSQVKLPAAPSKICR